MAAQRMAALVKRDRFLKADVAAFEPPHDRFELAHRGFERQRGDVGSDSGVGGIRHGPCFGPFAPMWSSLTW